MFAPCSYVDDDMRNDGIHPHQPGDPPTVVESSAAPVYTDRMVLLRIDFGTTGKLTIVGPTPFDMIHGDHEVVSATRLPRTEAES